MILFGMIHPIKNSRKCECVFIAKWCDCYCHLFFATFPPTCQRKHYFSLTENLTNTRSTGFTAECVFLSVVGSLFVALPCWSQRKKSNFAMKNAMIRFCSSFANYTHRQFLGDDSFYAYSSTHLWTQLKLTLIPRQGCLPAPHPKKAWGFFLSSSLPSMNLLGSQTSESL